MNRAQRRAKDTPNFPDMDSPCSIMEVLKISRAAAEDVVTEYAHKAQHLQVAMTIQLEIIKDLVIRKGLISQEELEKEYNERVQAFMKRQQELLARDMEAAIDESNLSPEMKVSAEEIEVKIEEGNNGEDVSEG